MNNIYVNTRSSIRIMGSKTIYFDPLEIQGNPQDADIIFVTHVHYDHFSPEDIKKVIKDDTKMIVPVGGKYTMDADEAAEFINQKPRGLVVPIHYANPEACNRFLGLLKPEVEVRVF